MEEIKLPGTTLAYPKGQEDVFAVIEPVLTATGGLTLRQVCDLTGLPASTIQNWVKRGWVASTVGKRYGERHLMRILLINMMRDAMPLERIVTLMAYINGSVEDEGDDIIPDRLLYAMLCRILRDTLDKGSFDEATIHRRTLQAVDDYPCTSQTAKEKLIKTLLIMTWASLSSFCRQKSEQAFQDRDTNE
ncbi:MAG: DUF1836 domain-containing protein [Clostridiales bacterium]|nr:DUF1836 domain-containing protein [Clostridiales bacterium]